MLRSIVKMFGGSDEKVVAKMRPDVDAINRLEPEFERLSDGRLMDRTGDFQRSLASGTDIEDILPEAFAAVRESAKRTLGQRHYDVQIVGGIVLHQGKIAEMKTGEGKTLVATLPAYLNSLTGGGVHVVTVNDYLARRDAHWMGAVYAKLGVTVGALQNQSALIYDHEYTDGDRGFEHMRPASRQQAYSADITYGTNNEFGFDYLRDNMVTDLSMRVQRDLAYAIVDEVDNILIDEARTPLIISGPADMSARDYARYAKVAPSLQPENDFTVDEKHRSVALTQDGISKLEKQLNVKNLYGTENFGTVHHIENALKAQIIFQRDREYVVQDGEVVIVDEFTGRLMQGRRYSDGLHQAIEAKESVRIQPESITYATITLQNYFRIYRKLAGMTGTAATEAEEFDKIYKLDVVSIPTNMPMIRGDSDDLVFRDQRAKYRAVVKEIEERYNAGQPVLVRDDRHRQVRNHQRSAQAQGHSARGTQRQAARAGGADSRPDWEAESGHGGYQHGRTRHRHCARRQPRSGRGFPPWTGTQAISVFSTPAASTSSAPSATRRGASTISSADAPAVRATPAPRNSTSPWTMI